MSPPAILEGEGSRLARANDDVDVRLRSGERGGASFQKRLRLVCIKSPPGKVAGLILVEGQEVNQTEELQPARCDQLRRGKRRDAERVISCRQLQEVRAKLKRNLRHGQGD